TSAIASAAVDIGRSVDSVGTMAQATSMQPNTRYGAARKIGDACSATTDSLTNSLCSVRYGCHRLGAERFCSQARHMFTQPVSAGASNSAATMASACDRVA